MTRQVKPITSLGIQELESNPVWEYTNTANDETAVRPLRNVPVSSLVGRVAATQIGLANGSRVWALIGNVDCTNAQLTEHFLTLSVEHSGRWFTLARYHDFDYAERGPAALAEFLGLHEQDIFPIQYDIRDLANGLPASLTGTILKEPRVRLTRQEIIGLAVP